VYIYLPWSISRQQTSLPNTSGPPEERKKQSNKEGDPLAMGPHKEERKKTFLRGKIKINKNL
jgi:hypothetical protein